MFGVIRILVGILVFLLCFIFVKCSKLLNKWPYYLVSGVVTITIITVLAFIPLENAFISFESAEQAYRYVIADDLDIDTIVEGEISDLVVGRNGSSSTYLIIPKDKTGWKLGLGIDTKTKAQRIVNDIIIRVYQYKNSQDYFITVMNANGGPLDIEDANHSIFKTQTWENTVLDQTFVTYYASVPNLSPQFWIAVNGQKIENLLE